MSEELEKVVLTERRGRILIVTLNRPEAGNSINPAVASQLDEALNMAEADSEVYAVILTGAGSKIFCGGMDLKHMAKHGAEGVVIDGHGFAGLTERFFSKPLICAVNGFALGGGTEFALACDIVIAADHAKFGLPEVKRGILAGAGGPIRLIRAVPKAIALEIMMTGDHITAQRALEIGLVNAVVPYDQLMDEAIKMAERIVCNAPLSVRGAKELAYKSYDMDLKKAFELNVVIGTRVGMSEDAIEGPRAFAEKRAPQWKGR